MQSNPSNGKQKGKTGPRGGKHSQEACEKMRAAWAERKRLLELGRRVDAAALEETEQAAND